MAIRDARARSYVLAAKLGKAFTCCPAICPMARGRGAGACGDTAMGQVDILIANAGITRDNLALRDEDRDEVIKVNLT